MSQTHLVMLRDALFLLFILTCVWIVLKGLSKYEIPLKTVTIVITIWVLVLAALSISGFLNDFSNFPPRIMLVLIIPLLVLIWFVLSKHTNAVVNKVPAEWMVKMQSFRILVELFIWWAYLQKDLPIQMTFEGRNFDILVGLTAPLVAMLWLKQGREKPMLVLIWNILGLLVLLNIVVTAVLSMPTPNQYFFNEPANTLVGRFPWVYLPGIFVTLAIALHLISIRQMAQLTIGQPLSHAGQ